MTFKLEVLAKGFSHLLVDGGNHSSQHQGITPGGPMDEAAFTCANLLVGNQNTVSFNTLELIGECCFKVRGAGWFAATGPNIKVFLDDLEIPTWESFFAPSNSRIRLKPCDVQYTPQRFYLAVKAGFYPNIGKPLAEVENLEFAQVTENAKSNSVRSINKPDYSLDCPINVILGYQAKHMDRLALAQFFNQSYTLTPDSNRMGYRLSGEALPALCGDMYSEGLHTGAIQVPPNGQPIVMLADRQTLGGYPKIGAVARFDLPRFVQACPGESLCFQPIDVYTARNNWRLKHNFWHKMCR